jgi:hypothetical protein
MARQQYSTAVSLTAGHTCCCCSHPCVLFSCHCRLTDGSTVYKLTGPIGHFNIFAVPAGRAALFKAISTILDTR